MIRTQSEFGSRLNTWQWSLTDDVHTGPGCTHRARQPGDDEDLWLDPPDALCHIYIACKKNMTVMKHKRLCFMKLLALSYVLVGTLSSGKAV